MLKQKIGYIKNRMQNISMNAIIFGNTIKFRIKVGCCSGSIFLIIDPGTIYKR